MAKSSDVDKVESSWDNCDLNVLQQLCSMPYGDFGFYK